MDAITEDWSLEIDKKNGKAKEYAPDLSRLGLRSLPEGFETIDFLAEINLSHNKLRSVPMALADMRHPSQSSRRTVIDLRGNPLNEMRQEDLERLRNSSAGPRFLLPEPTRPKPAPIVPTPFGKYYEILGVPPNAPKEVITKAYYGLSMLFHPDKYTEAKSKKTGLNREQMADRFKEISVAYEHLAK